MRFLARREHRVSVLISFYEQLPGLAVKAFVDMFIYRRFWTPPGILESVLKDCLDSSDICTSRHE